MAEPVSFDDINRAPNGMVKGEDGYFTVQIHKDVNTDIGTGKIIAVLKLNDVSLISSQESLDKISLSLAPEGESTIYFPNNGMVSRMVVACTARNVDSMVLTLVPEYSDDLYRFHLDLTAALQLILPVNQQAFISYRPGTVFTMTVDFDPDVSKTDSQNDVVQTEELFESESSQTPPNDAESFEKDMEETTGDAAGASA